MNYILFSQFFFRAYKPPFPKIYHDYPKPQLEFKDGVDNFKPFLPKIKQKPHSLSPLNLKFSESGDYSHPYQEELNNFVPQMEDETILPVIRNFDIVPLIYVDEESKLSSLLADVGTCSIIGVDLEVLKLNFIMSNFQFHKNFVNFNSYYVYYTL